MALYSVKLMELLSILTIMNNICFLELLQICDSLFPVGAFTLSNGMVTYVQRGKVSTAEDLKNYLYDFIKIAPYQDLGTMVLAAKNANDIKYICQLDELYSAFRCPMEVRQGSSKLCIRLLKAAKEISPFKILDDYYNKIINGQCIGQHSIAVGLFAASHNADIEQATLLYGYSLLSALTTNAVKSVPLRQLDGQKVLRESFPMLYKAAKISQQINLDNIGIGAAAFDIFSMEHETLYSRLYMS